MGRDCEASGLGALEGGSNHWIDGIHTYGNNLKSSYDVVEFNFDIAIHHGSEGWGDDDEVEVEKVKAFDVIVDGINFARSRAAAAGIDCR